MALLLDSHAFLWFASGDTRLSRTAIDLIEAPESTPVVSVASVWEIGLKIGIGKLELDMSFVDLLEQARLASINVMPILPRHVQKYIELPLHHRDPFDRMLAAQALDEQLPVISRDVLLDKYGIKRIW